jgi:hypothetical protein
MKLSLLSLTLHTYFFCCLLVPPSGTRVLTLSLMLARQALYHLNHFFVLAVFQVDLRFLPGAGLTLQSYTWDHRSESPCLVC